MHARWQRAVLAATVVAVVCAGVVTLQRGVAVLIAAAVVGAVVGVWAVVYARAMCACEPLKVPDLWWAAAYGALSAPGVLVLEHAFGPVVWVLVAVGALVWAAAISDDGHVHGLTVRNHGSRSPGRR